jgi:Protein of unknown function (DUF3363)
VNGALSRQGSARGSGTVKFSRRENGGIRRELRLEAAEIARVGREMAAEHGLTYTPSKPGEFVAGSLAGVATLASGRFATIEDGLGFQLVPWQPVPDKRIGQHISGVMRDSGGFEWGFGRKRGLGL